MACDPTLTYAPLRRVAILGGTHGDEVSGVFLARHWMKDPSEIRGQTFSATPLPANQPAVERCIRYVDRDLNRSFLPHLLSYESEGPLPYEVQRARELNQQLGPRGSEEAMDLIVDLHNTTSNMGDCLILNQSIDELSAHLAAYIQANARCSRSRVLCLELPLGEEYDVSSVGKHNLAVELGPQPQGVVRAENLGRMRQIVRSGLEFVELFNQGTEFPACDLEVYQLIGNVDFPRDAEGEICAMIHPELQDQDWLPLNPGDPVFQTVSGETIPYSGNRTVYPVFINEPAYYKKGMAFCVTKRVRSRLPRIRRESGERRQTETESRWTID